MHEYRNINKHTNMSMNIVRSLRCVEERIIFNCIYLLIVIIWIIIMKKMRHELNLFGIIEMPYNV